MSKVTETNGPIHGYKVFNPDWTCDPLNWACDPLGFKPKQYACPGKFEIEGELEICHNGMHFCQKLADCFEYYAFNPENKVAEVIAYGKVLISESEKYGNKLCTNKLEIVREVPWSEVIALTNLGNNCTGFSNTGNDNAGSYNTGRKNTGHSNTGSGNAGSHNTGAFNIGGFNTGDRNLGYNNAGDYNAGHRNTGDQNAGNRNTGDYNPGFGNVGDNNNGDMNTGNWNYGSNNVGDCNIGNFNTGDWNASSYNTGCFNTEVPTIMLFNKQSDWTYYDWLESDARLLLMSMPKETIQWVDKEDMTAEEKELNPSYETAGGYLKVFSQDENRNMAQKWWDELDDSEKRCIFAIPNFDEDIFYRCTGIKVY